MSRYCFLYIMLYSLKLITLREKAWEINFLYVKRYRHLENSRHIKKTDKQLRNNSFSSCNSR